MLILEILKDNSPVLL